MPSAAAGEPRDRIGGDADAVAALPMDAERTVPAFRPCSRSSWTRALIPLLRARTG